MKRLLLLIAPLLLLPLSGSAETQSCLQPTSGYAEHEGGQARADQVRQECVTYVTRECHLTGDEASILDRELTKYDRKKLVLWRERAELLDKLSKGDLSEYNYGQTLDRLLVIDVELRKCRQSLYQSLKPHFDNKKLAQIYLSIRHFKRDFSRSRHAK